MAADLSTIIKALESHKAEIEWVAAETLALQAVLTHFVAAIGSAAPSVRPLVLRAFDKAANEIRSEGGTELLHLGHGSPLTSSIKFAFLWYGMNPSIPWRPLTLKPVLRGRTMAQRFVAA